MASAPPDNGESVPDSRPPLGQVNFFAPTDWIDILADPNDETLTNAWFTELTRNAFPGHALEVQKLIVEALMHTRRIFLEDGMLSCGLVALPETESGPALWQICSGVVEIGTLDTNLDAASAFTQFLGESLTDSAVYIERFTTEIGTGVGLISNPQVFGDGSVALFPPLAPPADAEEPRVTLGLAVALAVPPGGGQSLLVIGQSLDANQVRELACVVALIAGKSTIEVYEQGRHEGAAPRSC